MLKSTLFRWLLSALLAVAGSIFYVFSGYADASGYAKAAQTSWILFLVCLGGAILLILVPPIIGFFYDLFHRNKPPRY